MAETATRLRELRDSMKISGLAMARAMTMKPATYGACERGERPFTDVLATPALASLVGRVAHNWECDPETLLNRLKVFLSRGGPVPLTHPVSWRQDADPTKKPGRKPGRLWGGVKGHQEEAFRKALARLSEWSIALDDLDRVSALDKVVQYGVMLVADLECAYEGREPAVPATPEEADQELRDFKLEIRGRIKKAGGRKLIFSDFRGPRAADPALPRQDSNLKFGTNKGA